VDNVTRQAVTWEKRQTMERLDVDYTPHNARYHNCVWWLLTCWWCHPKNCKVRDW